MQLRLTARIVIVVALIVAALMAFRLHRAGGWTLVQDEIGNASSGRDLAQAWCTECHAVERSTARTGEIAPDFVAIAERGATTALSLRVFLQSDHKTMPNFIIQPRDADDLVAYILSLRSK